MPSGTARPKQMRALVVGMAWSAITVALASLWVLTALRDVPQLSNAPRVAVLIASSSLVLPHSYLLLLIASLPLCFSQWRRAGRVLSALIVASMLWQWGRSWVAWPAGLLGGAPAAQHIRVATWNVARLGEFCGRSDCAAEESAAMACVGDVLAQQRPDMLALQEISLRRLNALEEALGWHCRLPDGQAAWIDYAGNKVEGHGGVAVCVPRDGDWTLQSLQHPSLPPSWHYIFSEVSSRETGALLNFLSVHFKPPRLNEEHAWRVLSDGLSGLRDLGRALAETNVEQAAQASQLLASAARFQDPTVLAGDFNSTRDTTIHHGLRTQFTDSWEHGGWGYGASRVFAGIPLRIDYIYTSAPHFSVERSRRSSRDCSDHRAVFSTISLNPERGSP